MTRKSYFFGTKTLAGVEGFHARCCGGFCCGAIFMLEKDVVGFMGSGVAASGYL